MEISIICDKCEHINDMHYFTKMDGIVGITIKCENCGKEIKVFSMVKRIMLIVLSISMISIVLSLLVNTWFLLLFVLVAFIVLFTIIKIIKEEKRVEEIWKRERGYLIFPQEENVNVIEIESEEIERAIKLYWIKGKTGKFCTNFPEDNNIHKVEVEFINMIDAFHSLGMGYGRMVQIIKDYWDSIEEKRK